MVFRLDSNYAQNRKAWIYVWKHVAIAVLIFWGIWLVLAPLCLGLAPNLFSELNVPRLIGAFLSNPFSAFKFYATWFVKFISREPLHYTWISFFGWRLPLLPLFIAGFYVFYHFIMNPF